ncbi:homeobox domain protein [Necator americanus]|uniref:Homeobox domain protein n=1 Tax=Necator americanus TaxID=51031 RepID=W2T619_NECAM|nr:homeobox domain protein [Necator americanus]ETN76417.1 homeobox domain protein [Necator americanus]
MCVMVVHAFLPCCYVLMNRHFKGGESGGSNFIRIETNTLVVKYGVPISLVAGPDEVCARCSFVKGKLSDTKLSSDYISSLTTTLSQVSQQEQDALTKLQSSMSEVKSEPSEDRLAIVENESESPSSLATPTPTPMNELDQAIKRALSVTNASLPLVVTLPLGFCPTTFNKETSLDDSRIGSGCDEEDDQQSCSEEKPKIDDQILEEFYLRDPFACASPDKRQALCQMLNIDPYRLKVWFQNRRRRDKVNIENQRMKEA